MEIVLFTTTTDRNATPFGHATIQFSEVLLFPQNKIQLITKVFQLKCDCESHAVSQQKQCKFAVQEQKLLGNLSIWFRLTCELDILRRFGTHFWMFDNKTVEKGHFTGTQANAGHSKTDREHSRADDSKGVQAISERSSRKKK